MSEINFLNIIQVLVAIALIGFILIQRGPGATAGSAFGGGGGGASGTVFGAKGSGSFLTKATALLATAFFIITMLIAIDASDTYGGADKAAEQDLGVFGSLEDAEPTMVPVDEVIKQATDNVNNSEQVTDTDATKQAIDDVSVEGFEVENKAEETTENSDDDGGGQQ